MAESSSSSTRVRTLTRQGSAFLSNYARTINLYPSRAEKLSILAAIHAIPGNEAFTLAKLSNWFTRYRNMRVHPSTPTDSPLLLDDETILFPKLTPTHLQQLRVLYKKMNDPAEGVVTFWAKRISADRQEVVAWIEYQQEKAKDTESPDVSPTVSEFPRPHLPTPAKSCSPQTRMPSLPPIAIKVEEHRQYLSPVSPLTSTDNHSVLDGLPPLARLAKPSVNGQSSTRQLTASIRECLKPDKLPSESPPRTAVEFAQKFERVENMIDAFFKKYQRGELIPLGWDASLKSVS